jgi:phenylalanyl-tRNA synthetase beta chain
LYDLKGALAAIGLGELNFQRRSATEFALGMEISAEGQRAGIAGQLASSEVGMSAPVFVAEIDLPNDLETADAARKFQELQRFPSISRDIALIAPVELGHVEIVAAIRRAKEPLLASVELFDLFSGKGAEAIGHGRKSLAYSLTYLDKNRTLTSEEVNVAHDRVRARLRSDLGVELRE